MKSKNKVLHKEDWEAIIAKPKSISKLPLGKLFLLNKKFVEQHYGFSHVKGSVDKTLEFYEQVVIPQEFSSIALEETRVVNHSNESGIENMNEMEIKSATDKPESEVVKMEEATYKGKVADEVFDCVDAATSHYSMEELKKSLEGIVLSFGRTNDAQLSEVKKFTSIFDHGGFRSITDYSELLQFACDAYKRRKSVKQSRSPFSLLLLLVKTVVVKSIHDEQNKKKEEHLKIRVETMKDLIEAEVGKDTSLLQSGSAKIEMYVRAFVSVNFKFLFEEGDGPIRITQLFGGNLKRSVKTAQNNCKNETYVEGNKVMVSLLQRLDVIQDVAVVQNTSLASSK